MMKLLDKSIATITGTIALALAAWLTLGTQNDYEQYSTLAHMSAYALLWLLWALTALKLGINHWRNT